MWSLHISTEIISQLHPFSFLASRPSGVWISQRTYWPSIVGISWQKSICTDLYRVAPDVVAVVADVPTICVRTHLVIGESGTEAQTEREEIGWDRMRNSGIKIKQKKSKLEIRGGMEKGGDSTYYEHTQIWKTKRRLHKERKKHWWVSYNKKIEMREMLSSVDRGRVRMLGGQWLKSPSTVHVLPPLSSWLTVLFTVLTVTIIAFWGL